MTSGGGANAFVRPANVAPEATLRVLRVPAEAHGMRLDVFLAAALRNTSRTRAKLIANRGAYSNEGTRLRANHRLRADQQIALWRVPLDEVSDTELAVLYEDEHLLAVDKPAHIAAHPTARHYHATVTQILANRHPGRYFSLIHRLDRETSGVLLVARSPAADRAFKRLLEERSSTKHHPGRIQPTIEKTYLAIVHGHFSQHLFAVEPGGLASLLIDRPLEPDRRSALRVKMCIASSERSFQAQSARTHVTLLGQASGYSAVECQLLTGRQHQIRVHLASLGCPVVGDKLYGADERLLARATDGTLSAADLDALELSRHALHARRYRLPHPLTGGELTVTAPLPQDLQEFWRSKAHGELQALVDGNSPSPAYRSIDTDRSAG